MASLNSVSLIGNLGREVECRYLPSGDLVASFSLATTEKWKTKQGESKEATQWHQCELFGKVAEIARDYLTKGSRVFVCGSLVYDEWVDKDGNKKTRAKVKLSGPRAQLVLLSGGGRGKEQGRDSESFPAPANTEDFQVADDDVPF